MDATSDSNRTAIHEAGHAVIQHQLGLGCNEVTIVPDYEAGEWGSAVHGGGEPTDADVESLKLFAEEAFWMRHAVAYYCGAEAVKRMGEPDWKEGADDDFECASNAIDRATNDEQCRQLISAYTKRRASILVEYFWPEIQAVAKELVESRTLTGDRVKDIIRESLDQRSVNATFIG